MKSLAAQSDRLVTALGDALLVYLIITIAASLAPATLMVETGVGLALWLYRGHWGLLALLMAWAAAWLAGPATVLVPLQAGASLTSVALAAALLHRARMHALMVASPLTTDQAARLLLYLAVATLPGAAAGTALAALADGAASNPQASRLEATLGAWPALWAGAWLAVPGALWLWRADTSARWRRVGAAAALLMLCAAALLAHYGWLPVLPLSDALATALVAAASLTALSLATQPSQPYRAMALTLPPLALAVTLTAAPAGIDPWPALAIAAAATGLASLAIRPSGDQRGAAGEGGTAGCRKEARLETRSPSRAVIEDAVDAIITIDRHGRILTFNRTAQRLFRYEPGEVIGRNVNMLMPEPYHSQHDRYIQNYIETGERKIIGIGRELVAQRRDGHVFPIYLAVSETSTEGEVTFTGIIRDISAEKAAREEIRRQNEQLSVTLQNAPLGMVAYRFDECFASTNRAFETMLGYNHAELAAMRFESLIHPDDRERFLSELGELRANRRQRFSLRLRLLRHDQRVVHVMTHNAVTHEEHGRPYLVIGQIEDMTSEIQAKEAAQAQQEKLTHVARLSTLGEMTAGIAHEINQPLTAIAMYARSGVRMLEKGIDDPARLRAALEKLSAQSLRAGEVIDRIQALVQNRDRKREPINLNDLVQEIRPLADSNAHVNDIEVVPELTPELPLVTADPVQIQQVLLNLIRNGIDAMAEIGCRYGNELKVRTLQPERSMVEVRVIDSGAGIGAEVSDKLFTPFTTTKADGMGMGLSICNSIITSHGGVLGFHNNPDHGATFFFQLPTEDDDDNG